MANANFQQRSAAYSKGSSVVEDPRCSRPPSAYPADTKLLAELKRVDYVLAYAKKPEGPFEIGQSQSDLRVRQRFERIREQFEKRLTDGGLLLEKETTEKHVFVKVHCPFERLAHEAERMRLEMPLKGLKLNVEQRISYLSSVLGRLFATEVEDSPACAPFEQSKLDRFENCDSKSNFFRPSLRSLMVHNILCETRVTGCVDEADNDDESEYSNDFATGKHGLQYLLVKEVYTDAYVLHDESVEADKDGSKSELRSKVSAGDSTRLSFRGTSSKSKRLEKLYKLDERHKLDVLWPRVLAYLPLNRIRNYFGEEISLYFAWSGTLMFSVLVPATFGVAIFAYGLWLSLGSHITKSVTANLTTPSVVAFSLTDYTRDPSQSVNATSSTATSIQTTTSQAFAQMLSGWGEDILNIIQWALDNNVTPWYSVVICLWGTLFLEMWKRRSSVLTYQWHVSQFESNELIRPQFWGVTQQDPVTGETAVHYSLHKRIGKYVVSFSVFLLMICIVLIISAAMIVYRIVLGVDYCSTGIWSNTTCTVVTSLCGTVANAVAIMILGKVYTILAYKLTDWENHKTETSYKDALIIKLFAFLFANSYTSLYYIAFFRGNDEIFGDSGILGLGTKYRDNCGNDGNCMSMLSLQVLVLIVMKPMPKIVTDVILPWVRKRRLCNQRTSVSHQSNGEEDPYVDYLERERAKPELADFTLNEYTEKVLQYGYLMMFAVSMPLAPLIVLMTHVMDRYVDSKRMLWLYRRPVAYIAQDIGVWYYILELLNVCGVITNALLIAFTSTWRIENLSTLSSKLAFILIFEHAVFSLKYLISALIPDMPGSVKLALRQEKYLAAKVMESGRFVKNIAQKTMLPNGNLKGQQSQCDGGTTESSSFRRKQHNGQEGLEMQQPTYTPEIEPG